MDPIEQATIKWLGKNNKTDNFNYWSTPRSATAHIIVCVLYFFKENEWIITKSFQSTYTIFEQYTFTWKENSQDIINNLPANIQRRLLTLKQKQIINKTNRIVAL